MNSAMSYAPIVVAVVLSLLLWPLARAAGKAQADRMRGLRDDLEQGHGRAFAVIGVVVVLVLLSHMGSPA